MWPSIWIPMVQVVGCVGVQLQTSDINIVVIGPSIKEKIKYEITLCEIFSQINDKIGDKITNITDGKTKYITEKDKNFEIASAIIT